MSGRRVDALAAVAAVVTLLAVLPVGAEGSDTATAQAPAPFVMAAGGDISPPTTEAKADDLRTAELAASLAADLYCTAGDNQYETGSGAMFASLDGFAGSWGRLPIRCPAEGNHDAADPGPGSPGFQAWFRPVLTGLRCQQLSPPCRPEAGYYDLDLDVDRNGQPDWYLLVINTNCGRVWGGTGDTATPSCANGSPQHRWLHFAQARRHGGATSGRKCSLLLGHHERFGTSFFADDPALYYLVGNFAWFHGDAMVFGHTHSVARTTALDKHGNVAPGAAGVRQLTAGAAGRSLTPHRVNPPRAGTRYRDNTRYGVLRLRLATARSPAGWLGGSWSSSFRYVGGASADPASAGCWP